MSRLGTVFRVLAVVAIAGCLLALQIPVAIDSGMSAVMSLDAMNAEGSDDPTLRPTALKKATEWNPHDYHALYRLGTYYIEQKDDESARAAYEACIRNSPGHLGALLGLADIYTRAGEFDKAHGCIDRAMVVAPTSWRVYLAAGTLENRQGDPVKAVDLLEKADRLSDSPVAGIYEQTGLAYLVSGDGEHALKYARRALAAESNDAEALLIESKALLLLHRPEESIQPLQSAIRASHGDALMRSDARLHLAGAFAETGDPVKSSVLLRDEVRESVDVPQVRESAVKIGHALETSLAGGTFTAEALGIVQCNLGFTYAALGLLDDALRCFEAAETAGAELDSSCVWAHAETLLRLERPAEALKKYESAVAMGPAPVQMRLGLAESLTRLGRTDEARMQYVLVLRSYKLSDDERERVQALKDALP